MKNKGFIAITSVMIIGSILALYMLIDSRTILDSVFDTGQVQTLHQNFYNTESCTNIKSINSNVAAGTVINLPDGFCTL